MNRIPIGIAGLDERISGGFLEKTANLICGTPGSCKTIFCLEFLYRGVTQFNQNALYVTIEEEPEQLRHQADQFGWNIRELEQQQRFTFLKLPIDTVNTDIIGLIADKKKRVNAQRVVIDSLSILAINAPMYYIPTRTEHGDDVTFMSNRLMPSPVTLTEEAKQFIYLLVTKIKDLDATTIFVSDSPEQGNYLTRDSVSEFVCDSVLKLGLQELGQTVCRTLEIKKMRSTPVHPGIATLEITEQGLRVKDFSY